MAILQKLCWMAKLPIIGNRIVLELLLPDGEELRDAERVRRHALRPSAARIAKAKSGACYTAMDCCCMPLNNQLLLTSEPNY